jgi:hypothetical protein
MECLQEISVERLRKANCVIIGKIPLEKHTTQSFLALGTGARLATPKRRR